MRFSEIATILKDIPYTSIERGKQLYDHILLNKPQKCLELGFAHGVASCYIAAALDELGAGTLTCVDLESSLDRNPNLEALLERSGLEKYVSIYREKSCYTWFLKKEIERNSNEYKCNPIYDLCFIDGPKNWTIDGFAFFLVDKLLKEKGYIIFDDYRWVYGEYSKDILDGIKIREMPKDQIVTPNIELVFKLLVMQHPNYSNFIIDDDWAYAQKVRSETKNLRIITTTSFKYRFLKKIKSILKP